MKILFLLRHAKAKKHDPTHEDFERPLKRRGIKSATLAGKFMSRQGIKPDLILSSPAERARRTAELALESAGVQQILRLEPEIYNASSSSLLKLISQIEKGVNVLLVVGHNPGIEETLEKLTGKHLHMPPGAMAKISLDIDEWDGLHEQSGSSEISLESFVTPEQLEDETDRPV